MLVMFCDWNCLSAIVALLAAAWIFPMQSTWNDLQPRLLLNCRQYLLPLALPVHHCCHCHLIGALAYLRPVQSNTCSQSQAFINSFHCRVGECLHICKSVQTFSALVQVTRLLESSSKDASPESPPTHTRKPCVGNTFQAELEIHTRKPCVGSKEFYEETKVTSGWAERQWRGPSCTFTVMMGLCWVSITSHASMNPV